MRSRSISTDSGGSSRAAASASPRCAGSVMRCGERMPARSLRRQLLGWLLLPLAAVVAVNLWTTYNTARDAADLITERILLSSARAIPQSIRRNAGVLETPIPPAALEMFASDPTARIVHEV